MTGFAIQKGWIEECEKRLAAVKELAIYDKVK